MHLDVSAGDGKSTTLNRLDRKKNQWRYGVSKSIDCQKTAWLFLMKMAWRLIYRRIMPSELVPHHPRYVKFWPISNEIRHAQNFALHT